MVGGAEVLTHEPSLMVGGAEVLTHEPSLMVGGAEAGDEAAPFLPAKETDAADALSDAAPATRLHLRILRDL
jgi:hypothetical protein